MSESENKGINHTIRYPIGVFLDSEMIREGIVSVLPPQAGFERINGVLAQMENIAGRHGGR